VSAARLVSENRIRICSGLSHASCRTLSGGTRASTGVWRNLHLPISYDLAPCDCRRANDIPSTFHGVITHGHSRNRIDIESGLRTDSHRVRSASATYHRMQRDLSKRPSARYDGRTASEIVGKAIIQAFLLWFVLLAPITIHAAEPPGTLVEQVTQSNEVKPLEWLKSGNYAALQRYYTQQQQAFESGTISDQVLYESFRKLYEDAVDNERFFDGWVQAYPDSYAPLLARGAFHYRMAWSVRGDKYINSTSGAAVDAMWNWLARAEPDLLGSLKLTPKPYLSALYLLNVAMMAGTPGDCRHWFEAGTAMDPGNTTLRYRYMSSLRPRWGGSYQQMQAFLDQNEKERVPASLLARMTILIHADLAEDAMQAGAQQQVFKEWGEVLSLAEPAGEPASTEALIGYARAAQDIGRAKDAERAIEQLKDRKVNDAWSLAQIAFIFARAQRQAEGWPYLLKAAELEDAWSQFTVGSNIYNGIPSLHKAADQEEGLLWVRRSAQQCFPAAIRFLAAHQDATQIDCPVSGSAGISRLLPWEVLVRLGPPQAGVLLAILIIGWIAVRRSRNGRPTQAVAPSLTVTRDRT
jgi:Domain of unknown function (DUF4034)